MISGKKKIKGACLATPAFEFFTYLFTVICAVDVNSFFIFYRFAHNFSVNLDFDFVPFHSIIPFHIISSGHIVCPISFMRYLFKYLSVIR
jgi:hypothetical protein